MTAHLTPAERLALRLAERSARNAEQWNDEKLSKLDRKGRRHALVHRSRVDGAMERLKRVLRPATWAPDDIRDAARVLRKQGGLTREQASLLGVHSG